MTEIEVKVAARGADGEIVGTAEVADITLSRALISRILIDTQPAGAE